MISVEGDEGLIAFARATAPRTERLKQRYGQESQPVSSDDEHDDYGIFFYIQYVYLNHSISIIHFRYPDNFDV